MKNGVEVVFPNFDAHNWSAAYGNYGIGGNMWAPDVIYNEKMKKWCMYMSINGPHWNSSIILLTSDNIIGPYVYQGPVIISGFNVSGAPSSLSYKNTDMELAIGTEQPYRRSFVIDGAMNVMPTGRIITLSGNANEENSFEQPTKLAPQTALFGKFGKQFDYEFAPMSFTIMRVKVEK